MKNSIIILLVFICYSSSFSQQVTSGLVGSYCFPAGEQNLKNQANSTEVASFPSNAEWVNYISNPQGGYDAMPVSKSRKPTAAADRFSNANNAYYFKDGTELSMPKGTANPTINDVSTYFTLPWEKLVSPQYTYSAWVKLDEKPSQWSIILNIGSSGGDQAISVRPTDIHVHSYVWDGYNSPVSKTITTTLPALDTWFHITSVRSASALSLYLNGVFVSEVAITAAQFTFYGMQNYPQALIGRRFNGTAGFTGYIDDVRIFSRALSKEEVLQDYKFGLDNNFSTLTSTMKDNMEESSKKFSLIPNPATDVLTILSNTNEKVSSARVLKSDGSVALYMNELTSNEINISSLTPGIYIFEVVMEEKVYHKKFVKQ
jgi:hypothetical protein